VSVVVGDRDAVLTGDTILGRGTTVVAHPDGVLGPYLESLAKLRDLGHRVGLHAVWPRAEPDARFDPVVAWHNPDPEYMRAPVAGAVNVMEAPFFDPEHYRSDSNQHWRHGCPHEALARGELEWLHLLTHPEIWAFDGATMRETMESLLDADRAARLEHLRHDRIDLS
jgi:hypothetical protein